MTNFQIKGGCVDAELYEMVTDDPNFVSYLETEIWLSEKVMLESWVDVDLYEDIAHEFSDYYTLHSHWYYISGTRPKYVDISIKKSTDKKAGGE